MKIVLALLAVSLLTLQACSSKSNRAKSDKASKDRRGYAAAKGFKAPAVESWELPGSNFGLTPMDENQVAYSSHSRTHHRHAQVYRFTLNDKKENRVTFSDGHSTKPVWSARLSRILYASDTDESKERSEFVAKNLDPKSEENETPADRSEIYSSDLRGHRIQRLTRSPGFDGDHDVNSQRDIVVFVSRRDGNDDLYVLMLNNNRVQRITNTKEIESSPRISPDGKKLAWLETAPEQRQTLIVGWPGRQREVILSLKEESIAGVNWLPDGSGIVFTTRLANGIPQVFLFRLETKCLTRQTFTTFPTEYPVISGGKLLYLSRKEDQSFLNRQILVAEDTCIDTGLDPLIIKE